jgi:hypothetical protein
MRIIVGPGIEATEKPNANAREKVTKIEAFLPGRQSFIIGCQEKGAL